MNLHDRTKAPHQKVGTSPDSNDSLQPVYDPDALMDFYTTLGPRIFTQNGTFCSAEFVFVL